MKGLGFWLLGLGAVIAIAALFMSTSVSTEASGSYYGRTPTTEVYNLGLLQHQMMIFVAGLAIAISGVALTTAGVVVEAIGARAMPAFAPSGVNEPAAVEIAEPVPVERTLTPAELAERDRDLNRATFMVAGGMVGVVGIIFLIVWLAS